MDVVFYVCIVTRGAVGARVWEVCVCLPCICCMFVSRVHHVAVLNAELCMLVAYAGCDHMKEAYSRVRRRRISFKLLL